MQSQDIATSEELDAIDAAAKKEVLEAKKAAWTAYLAPLKQEQNELVSLLENIASNSNNAVFIQKYAADLKSIKEPIRKDLLTIARKILRMVNGESGQTVLANWITNYIAQIQPKYSAYLISESSRNVSSVKEIAPIYDNNTEEVDARLVLRDNFDAIFSKYPETLIFGEDSGNIGDVNQGLEGMQEKYGELRVADVGIREATILGQGIGLAMRGLRPIA
jgi:hypothetical protein